MNRQELDLQLIKEAKKGNQRAFTSLFNVYYAKMYHYVCKIVEDDVDAEDVTMDTFERAFKSLNKYAPLFLFSTWLSRIARNTAIEFLRYKKRRWFNDLELDVVRSLKADIETPEQALISKQMDESYESALRILPKDHVQVFEMYNDGKLCREIAEELNITSSIVVGRIRYTRLWLTKLLINKQVS